MIGPVASTVVARNSSPMTTAPAGTLIGPTSLYLPVATSTFTGVRGSKVSDTYSQAYLTVLKGLYLVPLPSASIPVVET